MRTGARLLLALLAILALALPATASAAKRKPLYFVSLGDSYAQGVQPLGPSMADIPTKNGFANTAFRALKRKQRRLKFVQLGCGGATTVSMVRGTKRCAEKLPYRSRNRRTSQLTYAKRWLRRHRKQVRYVTVIIGGNDVAPCAGEDSTSAIAACVLGGIERIKKNLPISAKGVRSAAGRKAVIVGSTYPNVVLGQWVKSEGGKDLARLSIRIFREQINPTLRRAYQKRKIAFVNATRAFGGFLPLERTTTLAPYGEIPIAVANICRLAWYCADRPQGPDIHLRTSGYTHLAKLVLAKIRKLT